MCHTCKAANCYEKNRSCYDFSKLAWYYKKWSKFDDFFFFFQNRTSELEWLIHACTWITCLLSTWFLENAIYSKIWYILWKWPKPLSLRCLFPNLIRFVQASSENKMLLPEEQSSEITVLSHTQGMKFFREFLPSIFLSFPCFLYNYFDYFTEKSSFSKNLTQFASKIRHPPIWKFAIKNTYIGYWSRKLQKNYY